MCHPSNSSSPKFGVVAQTFCLCPPIPEPEAALVAAPCFYTHVHMQADPLKGRGAADNPPNRFELIRYEPLEDGGCDERPAPATQFFRDKTASIIATNDSPDIAFAASINPYRGCEHGCIYCYARPFHEY